ncbi:hypothetical protein A3Q56_00308 [Intoshia linei]|uniref:DNA polymerase delta small subunit n=1 Tax=Intoshia linei TaxID=1819745 RepID=A0A177BC58_9BILA|nr:hypothetical protein A3Q56_00308 [Intoshia linei]
MDTVEYAFTNECGQFMIHDNERAPQFYAIYNARIDTMRRKIEENCKIMFPSIEIKLLDELEIENECVTLGIICKHMTLNPSVLKDIFMELEMSGQKFNKNDLIFDHLFGPVKKDKISFQASVIHESDSLSLEDCTQRISLNASESDILNLINGVVVGVVGRKNSNGKFDVKQFIFRNSVCEITHIPIKPNRKYLAFVSGLAFGSDKFDQIAMDLMSLFMLRSESNIVGIVVAGNLITNINFNTSIRTTQLLEHSHNCDYFLSYLGTMKPIYIMPGINDISDSVFPQRPINSSVMPHVSKLNTNSMLSNPCQFNLESEQQVRFMGTSGENVYDTLAHTADSYDSDQYITHENILNAMDKHLLYGHLSPGSPDSLESIPVCQDAFIIQTLPNVYFAGNQPFFASRFSKHVPNLKLISIPPFYNTKSIALLDLASLDTRQVFFESEK